MTAHWASKSARDLRNKAGGVKRLNVKISSDAYANCLRMAEYHRINAWEVVDRLLRGELLAGSGPEQRSLHRTHGLSQAEISAAGLE